MRPQKPPRPSPRATIIVALKIFIPLVAVLIWWALENRVAPIPEGASLPAAGTLPLWVALASCTEVAGTVAAMSALLWSNGNRMKAVLRPNGSRLLAAAVMSGLAPFLALGWLPMNAVGTLPFGLLIAVPMLMVWYPVVCLIISVRNHVLRGAAFWLAGWFFYAVSLLGGGYTTLD